MKRFILIHVLFFVVILPHISHAQENFNIQPVSRIFNHWDRVSDFEIQGDLVYIAAETSGLQIVDISNPEEPRQLGYWDENPDRSRFICVEGNYAYISEYYDVLCIDITDPMDPRPVSSFHFEEKVDEIYLRNGNIFTVLRGSRGGRNEEPIQGGMAVLSFANPEEPVLINQYRLPEHINLGAVENSYFTDDLVFLHTVGDNNASETIILDILEVENIRQVGNYQQYFGTLYRNNDNLLALYGRSVRIYDIQNLPTITLLGEYEWDSPWNARIVTVDEDLAYILVQSDLFILDISNPREINVIREIENGWIGCSGMQVHDNFLIGSFVASLQLFDFNEIDNWDNPRYLIEFPEAMHNRRLLRLVGNNRLVHLFQNGVYSLRTVDIQNPQDPLEIVWSPVFYAYKDDTIAFRGHRSNDEHMSLILKSYNVSDPDSSVLMDSLVVTIEDCRFIGVQSILIDDNTAIVQCLATHNKLLVIDISNPDNLSFIADFSYDYGEPYFFSNGRLFMLGRGGVIDVYTFEDPDNPQIVNTIEGFYNIHQMTGNDNLLIIRDSGFHGLSFLDISNIEDINLITEYRFTRDGEYGFATTDAYLSGTHLYLSKSVNGIDILDIEDLENPVHVGSYNTPGKAMSCVVRDNFLYVADETNLGIYDVSEAMSVEPDVRYIPNTFGVKAYPNPFNSTFQLNYNLPISGQVGVKVYNLRGRVLYDQDLHQGLNTISIDGSNWATGTYFVNVEVGREMRTVRVNCLK